VKSYHLTSSKYPTNRINLNYSIDSTEDESLLGKTFEKRCQPRQCIRLVPKSSAMARVRFEPDFAARLSTQANSSVNRASPRLQPIRGCHVRVVTNWDQSEDATSVLRGTMTNQRLLGCFTFGGFFASGLFVCFHSIFFFFRLGFLLLFAFFCYSNIIKHAYAGHLNSFTHLRAPISTV
jgi:hypothetical protein